VKDMVLKKALEEKKKLEDKGQIIS